MKLRLSSLLFSLFISFWINTFASLPFTSFSAGKEIPQFFIRQDLIENFFTENPIDSLVFSRINGVSFKQNGPVSLSDLRYLRVLHYDGEGKVRIGELICNKKISKDLLEIFRILFDARYPIERMVLIDDYEADDVASMNDNNSSCFNSRTIAGTGRMSKHALGMAIDINPLYNPEIKIRKGITKITPENGSDFVDRTKKFKYKIEKNDLCYKEFIKHGFTWGGNWRSSKDYQHFEKN